MNLRLLTAVVTCLVATGPSLADRVLRDLVWEKVESHWSWPTEVQVVQADDGRPSGTLRIENHNPQGMSLTILPIGRPGVTTHDYALVGEVRYDNVQGDGYLEMLSAFEGGDEYFTRTLADAGLQKKLTGSSPWREFALPFTIAPGKANRPTKLTFRLILPAAGIVEIGRVRLMQFDGPWQNALGATGWWTGPTAGWIGGIGGALLGCICGLVGWRCSKGKSYRLAIAIMKTMIVTGVVLLVIGLVAVFRSQPYVVYYPLILLGLLLVILSPLGLSNLRRQQCQHELRQMDALDAGEVRA